MPLRSATTLPLPLWHYLVGAGAAVALTFVIAALVLGGGGSRPAHLRLPLPPRLADGFSRTLGGLAVGALLLLLGAGFFGAQGDWDSNLLPVSIWVIWWVGVTFVSALIGGIWPLIDPWRAIAKKARAPFRRDRPRCDGRGARAPGLQSSCSSPSRGASSPGRRMLCRTSWRR
jgi:hypothetical protein